MGPSFTYDVYRDFCSRYRGSRAGNLFVAELLTIGYLMCRVGVWYVFLDYLVLKTGFQEGATTTCKSTLVLLRDK